VLTAAKYRAQKAGIPFSLTLEYLVDLWTQQEGKCAVSRLPLGRQRSKWMRNPYTPSIDRIVPSDGYVEGNIRFVLECVNVALNEWGLDELIPVLRAVVDRYDGAAD